MSEFLGMELEPVPSHGLALILELHAAIHRSRLAVGGRVVAVRSQDEGAAFGYRCVLDDGTGQVDLLFLGRREVAGLGVGARCYAEGTARMDRGRLTVWNPLYRLEPSACER